MTTFEAEITYVDGGLLPRLAETLRAPVPYLDLRVLWGDGDAPDFWAEAAARGKWQFEQVSRQCFEVTFPDGTRLIDPSRAIATTARVLSTSCVPAGMSTICTSRVQLRVPDSDRGLAARCRSFRIPPKRSSSPAPRRILDPPRRVLPPDQGAHVLELLARIKRRYGIRALIEATGIQKSGLYKIFRGESAPTVNLALTLATMLNTTSAHVVEGRVSELNLLLLGGSR